MSTINAYVNEAGFVLRYQLKDTFSAKDWTRLYANLRLESDENLYPNNQLFWDADAPDGTPVRVFHFTKNTVKVDEGIRILRENGITVIDYRDNLK